MRGRVGGQGYLEWNRKRILMIRRAHLDGTAPWHIQLAVLPSNLRLQDRRLQLQPLAVETLGGRIVANGVADLHDPDKAALKLARQLAERLAVRSTLTFARDVTPSAGLAALIRAAYDPALPDVATDPSYALRIVARLSR